MQPESTSNLKLLKIRLNLSLKSEAKQTRELSVQELYVYYMASQT